MATINEQIDGAITFLADRGVVFSHGDVAAYADMEDMEDIIEVGLRAQRANNVILPLDEHPKKFLKLSAVEKWWVNKVLRWAATGLDYLFPDQIARSMSLAFLPYDEQRWQTPPTSLLEVGQQWAMIADGCVPGTFVSPWASVLRANPHFVEAFRANFVSKNSVSWTEELFDDAYIDDNRRQFSTDTTSLYFGAPIDIAVDQALKFLPERESDIVRHRLGIGTGQTTTLEKLGVRHGVTRERIRQIEAKSMSKLRRAKFRNPELYRCFWLGFTADFIQSKGALVIDETLMTAQRKLTIDIIGLNAAFIPGLGLYIVGTSENNNSLGKLNNLQNADTTQSLVPTMEIVQFLSARDNERLNVFKAKHRTKQITKTRGLMLREALRSLGRSAHYSEIAEEANRLFPERKTSTHNWHAPLSLPVSESLGIVWIGMKGMYGLKEHGYSRPNADIFETVALIVEEKYAETQRPVSVEVVLIELGKYRREVNHTSVPMALGFNDKLKSVGGGKYVPISQFSERSDDKAVSQFDIDAAFAAFSGEENTERG